MIYGKFLDPTTDIVFKKVFGDKKKKEILIDFLNAVLERPAGQRITDALSVDPNNMPEYSGSKHSIIDVKCVDERGITYIIEMQVADHPGYLQRSQYYTAVEVARQLNKGDKYTKLAPVIFVGIVADFVCFNNPWYVNHHYMVNTRSQAQELQLMELHFVELKKFDKGLKNLETVIDQWAYFLKHASDADKIPKQLEENDAIAKAFKVLELTNFSRAELERYDALVDEERITAERAERLAVAAERLEAAERKLAAAEQKAIVVEQQGREAEKRAMARALLADGMPINKISKLTKLSVSDIEKLS